MIFQLVVNTYGNFKIESLVLFEGDSYEELIKEQCAYAEAKEAMGLKEGENFFF